MGPLCEAPRCNEPVFWALSGLKRMLVNAQPHPDGTMRVTDTGGDTPVAKTLTVQQRFGMQGKLYLSHFATCPEAKRYRRRRNT